VKGLHTILKVLNDLISVQIISCFSWLLVPGYNSYIQHILSPGKFTYSNAF
jgi:hypothetical protein